MVKVYSKILISRPHAHAWTLVWHMRNRELYNRLWHIGSDQETERVGSINKLRYLCEIFCCVNCEPRVFCVFGMHIHRHSTSFSMCNVYCRWHKCWRWCDRWAVTASSSFFLIRSTFPTSTHSIKLNYLRPIDMTG